MKQNIRHISLPDLQDQLKALGEPGFRAKQVYEWLWSKSATTFAEMSNLPAALREKLAESYSLPVVQVDHFQKSNDGTIKNAFRLHDGYFVEGVLIPTETRMTACISSQVGCSLSCKFCATGKMDRMRNIDFDEIVDQVALIRNQALEHFQIPLTNIVYMGMGEPLLNYANTMRSVERITAPDGLGMSPQRITISTAGIAKMIHKLGEDGYKGNLALSLHAANEAKRNEIMPINETNNLEVLAEALNAFYDKTGTRVTLEYILFDHFNDSMEDAAELAAFAKRVTSKINLIEYNSIGDGLFRKAKRERREAFVEALERKNIIVNVRRSRGKDIDAACGQLANKG